MSITIDRVGDVTVLEVNESRLTFATLPQLSTTSADLIARGDTRLLVDLSRVQYLDSAAIGWLMDLYRQVTAADGALRVAGVQPRVEMMLTMTGTQHFLEVHADRAAALASFRS